MFCQFCKVEIPASWARVIASNVCPACGEAIISEESKKIMDELKEAIAKMSASPEELASWIMSTFDVVPRGTIEATAFHGRKPSSQQMGQGEDMSTQGIKWANTPTGASAQFMKRAGADKVLKDPKLAAIAQAINSINATDGDPEIVNPEEDEMQEQQRIAALAVKARAQGRKLTMKEVLANESNTVELNMGGDVRPLSDAETELVKHLVSGPTSGDPDLDGLQDLPEALQRDRLKRLAAQRELKFGGSAGKIKRSE